MHTHIFNGNFKCNQYYRFYQPHNQYKPIHLAKANIKYSNSYTCHGLKVLEIT
ncbi:hypothetical protein F383_28782 [Gossypium arboreum]|uniref:Uncharacterized protein n=1 Tax=Gossypium arboreum TaxID=29729 RepID=A0A0B0PGA6_GOSAR|nr:hypothetical protein F383_28782 [Gossypium arboreum]